MNQISLAWGHYPDAELFIVVPDGITHAQLRHYARGLGFLDFQNRDGSPLLCGYSLDQKDALRCALETSGYEIADEQIFSATMICLYMSDDAEGSA